MKNLNKNLFSFLALLVPVGFYIYMSVNIRPIADDYCAAAGSTSGVIEYMLNLTQSWSGDYTQILFNGLLVALPLNTLPFFFLGLLTLFLFIALLLLLLYFIAKECLISSSSFRSFAILSTLVMIFWNLYWALPAALHTNGLYARMLDAKESFSAVFGWPTVIVQYLIVPLLLVLLSLIRVNNPLIACSILITVGFIIGTSGYALALAVLVFTLLFLFSPQNKFGQIKPLSMCSGIFLGVLVSYFSLGAQLRSQVLVSSREEPSVNSLMRWIAESSLEFAVSLFNIGVLFVLLFGYLCSQHSNGFYKIGVSSLNVRSLLNLSSIFLVIYFAAISASEFLTYNAFWHLITFRAFLFFYFLLFGIYLGKIYKVKRVDFSRNFVRIGSPFILFMSLLAVFDTNSLLIERRVSWERGPATLPGISDISPQGNWVDSCWDRVSRQDKYPVRD